jgi:DnaA-homolog protein
VKQLALGVTLRANAVFANFSAGENVEVLAALKARGRDPLWLYGGRGSGKTHLLQAACAATEGPAAYLSLTSQEREASARDAYALGSSRVDAPAPHAVGAAGAPQARGTAAKLSGRDAVLLPPEALRGLADCEVVCIDDVGTVAGDLAWEESLFRLFNEAQESGSSLIFAAAAAPRQIEWRLEDWRSRAGSCVVYHVRELDEAGRAEALRLRAGQRGIDLPAETLDYLMKRMPRDLHSLFEILDELDEASLAAQRRLTIPFIRDALERRAGTGS